MKVSDLLIKVQKAEEAVTKREITLSKQIARELQQREFLITKGVDLTGKHPQMAYINNDDLYWEICTWLAYKESVEISKKVLEEKKRILNTWKELLNEATKKENICIKEIPASMKDELVKRLDEYDFDWTEISYKAGSLNVIVYGKLGKS